jgi:hypothetical protein
MWLLRTIESASNIRGCDPRLDSESRAMAKHGGRTSSRASTWSWMEPVLNPVQPASLGHISHSSFLNFVAAILQIR